jgi:cysteine desulfurase
MRSLYLDNNATTPMLPAVWEAMRPYLCDHYGNPASAHHVGRRARQALEDAREQVAALLDADPDEVLFTSGATEANNLAIAGLSGVAPGHIVASPVEHPSVAEPVRNLGESGFSVSWLPVDEVGLVQANVVGHFLRPETRLVTVQLANHETGALQPLAALVSESRGHSFHCDATQAVGKVPVCFHRLGVTSLSFSAHKFHGPKGIGVLLLRHGTQLRAQLWGGHQQQGRRPGTEPVALVVGLATALQLAHQEMEARLAHVRTLRQRFLDALAPAGPIVLNGPVEGGVPHTINISFPGCSADALLMNLDLAAVACSTGSACSSGSLLPSPVLQAMGIDGPRLKSAMRFSLSPLLSLEDMNEAASRIVILFIRLRQFSDVCEPSSRQ